MTTTTADPLDSLVHLSHLLGNETRLVQPGGGNTSIKEGDALLVKGSGTDLRTIGRDGFTRLSLARLAPLADAESMSDAEMMRFMAELHAGRGAGAERGDAAALAAAASGHRPHPRRRDHEPHQRPRGQAERLVGELFEGAHHVRAL